MNNLKLLLIVDMQKDFMVPGMALPVNGADKIIEPTNKFIKDNENAFDMVVATMDTHNPDAYKNSAEGKQFPMHCVKGTKGWDFAIDPPYHIKIEKPVFDMWANDPNIPGINPKEWAVYVIGVAGDFCVKYAVAGFLQRGFKTIVLTDLTKGIGEEFDMVANREMFDKIQSNQLILQTAKNFQKA